MSRKKCFLSILDQFGIIQKRILEEEAAQKNIS